MQSPVLLSVALCLMSCTAARSSEEVTPSQEARPSYESICAGGAAAHLVLATGRGPIVARLHEAAAPQAVRRLAGLAKGSDPHLSAGQDTAPAAGYYDGLTFIHTQPHIEIVTDVRESGEPVEIDAELDAVALGLDRRRIGDAGEAMDIAQRELSTTYKRLLKSGQVPPRLQQWMDKLYSTHDAAFLVGVSHQEINEALGYVYQEGLESRPVTRGALMLKPLSPSVASARLSIALVDLPQRTGRWVVVGRVVEGLETAQEISVQPLADPGVVRSRHRPANPVRIDSLRLECRNTN